MLAAHQTDAVARVLDLLVTEIERAGDPERAEAIARDQGDQATLPNHLANRAELLILLGRASEAEPLLAEGWAVEVHGTTLRPPSSPLPLDVIAKRRFAPL